MSTPKAKTGRAPRSIEQFTPWVARATARRAQAEALTTAHAAEGVLYATDGHRLHHVQDCATPAAPAYVLPQIAQALGNGRHLAAQAIVSTSELLRAARLALATHQAPAKDKQDDHRTMWVGIDRQRLVTRAVLRTGRDGPLVADFEYEVFDGAVIEGETVACYRYHGGETGALAAVNAEFLRQAVSGLRAPTVLVGVEKNCLYLASTEGEFKREAIIMALRTK